MKILTGRYTNINSTARKDWNGTICQSPTVESAGNPVIVNHFDQKLIRMGKIITKKVMRKAFECCIIWCKQREWSGYEREWNKMSNWHLKILHFCLIQITCFSGDESDISKSSQQDGKVPIAFQYFKEWVEKRRNFKNPVDHVNDSVACAQSFQSESSIHSQNLYPKMYKCSKLDFIIETVLMYTSPILPYLL